MRLTFAVVGIVFMDVCQVSCAGASDPSLPVSNNTYDVPYLLSSMQGMCGDGVLTAQEECDPGYPGKNMRTHLKCDDFYVPGIFPITSFTGGEVGCYGFLNRFPCTYDLSLCTFDGNVSGAASDPYAKERDGWTSLNQGEWILEVNSNSLLLPATACPSNEACVVAYIQQDSDEESVVWKRGVFQREEMLWEGLGTYQTQGVEEVFAITQHNVLHVCWAYSQGVQCINEEGSLYEFDTPLRTTPVLFKQSTDRIWAYWKDEAGRCVWDALFTGERTSTACAGEKDIVWVDENTWMYVAYNPSTQILNTGLVDFWSDEREVVAWNRLEGGLTHVAMQRMNDGRVWLVYVLKQDQTYTGATSVWNPVAKTWEQSHKVFETQHPVQAFKMGYDSQNQVVWAWNTPSKHGVQARRWNERHSYLGPVEQVSASLLYGETQNLQLMQQDSGVCLVWEFKPAVPVQMRKIGMRCVF